MATIEKGEGRLNRLKTAISDVQKVVSNFIESTGGDPRQGLNLIYSNVDYSKYRWVFWVFIKIKQKNKNKKDTKKKNTKKNNIYIRELNLF